MKSPQAESVSIREQARRALVQALPLLTMGLVVIAVSVFIDGGGLLLPAVLVGFSAMSALLRFRLLAVET